MYNQAKEALALPEALNFEVMTVPVSDVLREGVSVGNNKYATIDQYGNIFDFVSNRYKPLSYADAVEAQNESIFNSNLNLSDMVVKWTTTPNGGRMKRYVTFPQEIIEPVINDVTQFGLELFNSYDSSYAFEQTTKAFRLWCLNGCTTPMHTYNARRKHTTNISIEGEGAKLALGIEAFRDSESRYQKWSKTPVLTYEVERLFKATLTKKEGGKYPYTVKTFDELILDWKRTSSDMGRNVWSAYNVATAWATHVTSERGGFSENLSRQRNAKVASMLNHDLWKELEEG